MATPAKGAGTRVGRALLWLARPLQAGEEEAQSLVELALLVPILLLLALAMVDFGRALAASNAASNAAKQASLFASQNFVSSYSSALSCLQPAAQQIVSGEISGTVALAAITHTTGYTGDVDIQATVKVRFTPVTPFISQLAGGFIRQSASDHVPFTLGAPLPPNTPVLTVTSPSTTVDQLTWSMPITSMSVYTATYPPPPSSGQPYTSSFLLYQSLGAGGAPCPITQLPIDPAYVSGTTYTESYTVPVTAPNVYSYSIQVMGPHPPDTFGIPFPSTPQLQQ